MAFSTGWFTGFLKRKQLSLHEPTKRAQTVPGDYKNKITSWLQFNRRAQAKFNFELLEIANVDQTPISFEFLNNKTYDTKAQDGTGNKLPFIQQHHAYLSTFFSLTPRDQALGEEWWERMTTARPNRSDYVGPAGTKAQLGALARWESRDLASEGSYNRLHELKIPVLVADGDSDILVPTVNSWTMFKKKLTNAVAHLALFPDVGHGFVDQYSNQFSQLVNVFLDA
ncbi:hypothetical protein OIDMADRAFT_35191 [Oidiodendron maius Zn]|uniref:HTH CENPB-type domain-containing protein n=1 Tax=Oidiodendron maius (strain Zn) TaxID=913774 RepID=A0A0C3GS88_OIDMZ|nr:hypothetical protein OIDMADRAFT_35191 [Oidiodendron maius Zn]